MTKRENKDTQQRFKIYNKFHRAKVAPEKPFTLTACPVNLSGYNLGIVMKLNIEDIFVTDPEKLRRQKLLLKGVISFEEYFNGEIPPEIKKILADTSSAQAKFRLKILHRIFSKMGKKNPLFVYEGFRICRQHGFIIPEWIFEHFDEIANNLFEVVEEKQSDDAQKTASWLQDAFKFNRGLGGTGDFFSQYKLFELKFSVWKLVEDAKRNPSLLKYKQNKWDYASNILELDKSERQVIRYYNEIETISS